MGDKGVQNTTDALIQNGGLGLAVFADHGRLTILKEKWSHFDLKSWVTGGTKIRLKYSKITRNPGSNLSSDKSLNISGQNDSIFSFSRRNPPLEILSSAVPFSSAGKYF